ncbi:hypothetical protein, partial [Brevibacillus parabrevis]|uniref:hypothetical protein n=1 Tax=Brevibacillus parabrevis TaxID=54914 RepID=UPI000AE433BF
SVERMKMPTEVDPHSYEAKSLASNIKTDEVRKEYLEQSYRFYTRIVELDKKNMKMSEEFKTEFMDFAIQMETENPSEMLLGILISRLYVRKMGLEYNDKNADDRVTFNKTASDLKMVFGK